jgi:fucose 4-O-acetylase-like acetyltransferase
MTRPYLPFVDWLKAVGVALIVFGHVDHGLIAATTPPFYPKQLGVTMFLFATGYTLANERRGALRVIISRWFDVAAYGLLFALLLSGYLLIWIGDANLSNYLPLAGGLNVLFNDFPANPTTWYIGTYLHLLVVWALVFRGRSVGVPAVLAALAVEIVMRGILLEYGGQFVAYQSLFNWLAVLTLGLVAGRVEWRFGAWSIPAAVLFVALWPVVIWRMGWLGSFPFRIPANVPVGTERWVLSLVVSAGYIGYTLAAFAVFSRLQAPAVVRFFARNTLIVFVAHMPIYRGLEVLLTGRMDRVPLALTEFAICFVGLALVSEVIRPRLQPLLDAVRRRLLTAVGESQP